MISALKRFDAPNPVDYRNPMRWIYHPGYDYGGGLADNPRALHGFVLRRPSEIRACLVSAGVVAADAFEAPERVTQEDLLRVHHPALVASLRDPRAVAAALEFSAIGSLPPDVVWRAIVEPQLLAAGGTLAALRTAANREWAANLSGGFHHARRDLAHGFCLVNDVAVAVARLRCEGIFCRILILDLDLHQGDGNATIFADDPDVFTISVHEDAAFPAPKVASDQDIGLPSWARDDAYLEAVDSALAAAKRRFVPDVLVYVAGSDPFELDPIGSLRLTREGMMERDHRVAEFASQQGCGVVVLPAGGYTVESASLTAAGFATIAALAPE